MSRPRTTERQGSPAGTLARHRARNALHDLILSGEYRPGQRLVQLELAQRLGVAQSVIRESLLELQFCGLVDAVDNLGMFVSELDARRLLSAYQIREMFEGLAARLCCERASRADVRELSELVQRVYELARQGDLEAMSNADQQFHFRMIQMSGNEMLIKLTEGYRVLGMFVRANRNHRDVRKEHLEIIEAIETNQPQDAEQLARRHARAAREAIERQIAEGTFIPHCVIPTTDGKPSAKAPKRSRIQGKKPSKGKSK